MDFTKFSDPDFDPKAWINEAFRLPNIEEKRDQHAATLVMKLQLFIQEVDKSLEDTSQQVVQVMPKILRELESLQQEASVLQNKMQTVQKDVQKVEHDTAQAMDSLLKLDLAKSRMQEVDKSLKEMDNWTMLTQGINEIFASGNADLIAAKLKGMQQCLKVIGSRVPDYAARCDLLERLKDQFVALVSPSVIAALSSQSTDAVQYFVMLFGELERMPDLQKYYQKCLKNEVQRMWTEFLQTEDTPDVAEMLNNLYDGAITMWFNQLKWASHAFKQHGTVICDGLRTGLAGLEPSIESFISSNLDTYSDQLGALIRVKQMCDNFARTMESNCTSVSPKADPVVLQAFLVEIFRPLRTFVVNYKQYEQSELLAKLNTLNFTDHDMSENVVRLNRSTEIVAHECLQAIERCHQFTNGVALPALLKALQVFFANYLTKITTCLDAFKAQVHTRNENWEQFDLALSLVRVAGNLISMDRKVEDEMQLMLEHLEKHAKEELSWFNDDAETKIPHDVSAERAFEGVIMSDVNTSRALRGFFERANTEADARSLALLPDVSAKLRSFNEQAHDVALDTLLGPMKVLLRSVAKLEVWRSAHVGDSLADNLPSFSLAPQEYITKVGQYLMTFAHHLEPVLSADDPALCAALRRYKLPYIAQMPETITSDQVARLWLESVGGAIMHHYAEAVLNIKELTPSAAKQLSIDIEYFYNVAEDLGLAVSPRLLDIRDLVKATPEEFANIANRKDTTLASLIRSMRKLQT